MNKEQARKLLILCGWLLSSSNRILRDYTSQAMIEILRNEFDLCIVLLKAFAGVNDPYILERLYGVVFGTCCKRIKEKNQAYLILAEYVYSTIFDQETVYPDILLRDYARLIIERFLWENPDYNGCIVHEKLFHHINHFLLNKSMKITLIRNTMVDCGKSKVPCRLKDMVCMVILDAMFFKVH